MRYREIALTEKSVLDGNINSMGKIISGNPDAFRAWFGKSKAVDKEGRPLVLFHGTVQSFSKFDPKKSNSNTGTGVPPGAFVFSDHTAVASSYTMDKADVQGWRDPKITDAFRKLMKTASFDDQLEFLANHPSGYDEYKEGGNVMPVYLRILKPLVVDAQGYHWNDINFKPKGWHSADTFTTNEIATYAKENGYDSAVIKNVKDTGKGPSHFATTFFVFNPSQIKSAISNTGYKKDSDELTEASFDVFHGTDTKFKAFDDRHMGSANGTAPINMTGFNFTDSPEVAKSFGDNVMSCKVTINHPRIIDAKGANYSQFKHKLNDILDKIDRSKFDGIIIKNYMDAGKKADDYILSTHYIPFSKSQISITESADTLKLPDIEVGDEVMVGKFKNRSAIVKGFTKDDHNQPVLKTTKGDQKLFKPRLKKLMQEVQKQLAAAPVKESVEVLTEGRDAYLFHGSPLISALGILKAGAVRATQDYDHSPKGVSLSRDYKTALDFGTFWERQYPVIFVFDQTKIVQNLKINTFLDTDPDGTPREKEFEEMIKGNLPLSPYLVSINVSPHVIYSAAHNVDWMDSGIEEDRWFNHGPYNHEEIIAMLKALAAHPLLNKWNHRAFDKIEQPNPVNTFLPLFYSDAQECYALGFGQAAIYCDIKSDGDHTAIITAFHPEGLMASKPAGGAQLIKWNGTIKRILDTFEKQAAKVGVTVKVTATP